VPQPPAPWPPWPSRTRLARSALPPRKLRRRTLRPHLSRWFRRRPLVPLRFVRGDRENPAAWVTPLGINPQTHIARNAARAALCDARATYHAPFGLDNGAQAPPISDKRAAWLEGETHT